MISAGKDIYPIIPQPTTTPKDRGVQTYTKLPKSIHPDQKQLATKYCGGGWTSNFKAFLRKSCVDKVYNLFDAAVIGKIGKKPGVVLSGVQLLNFANIVTRSGQGGYMRAVIAMEYRAGKTGKVPQVVDNQSANYANAFMLSFVNGINKLNVLDLTTGKMRDVDMKGLVLYAREIALKGADPSKIIFLPPPLAKEIKLINKIFPKRWARHLIEQAGRMYVTTIKELKIKGVRPTAINYNEAAKKVVQRVRKIAWAAVNRKQTVALAPARINDAKAKAQYKKIARAEKSASRRKIFKDFMWVVTDTFVLRADQVAHLTDPSKKRVKISFRKAPIKTYIKNGYTKELRRTGPKTMPRFSFFRKIKQADTIRDQMTHALKRLYPQAAGLVTAKSSYDKNRKALDAKDRKGNTMIDKTTRATIRGMNMTFGEHYGLKKGSVTKKDAAPMSLHELEGKDVILMSNGKDPDYVVFKLSHLKSTGGVPLTVIKTIVDGYPGGNKALRAAAAIRRYQQAKAKLGDGAKDPAKLDKMEKTLVAQLKSLPDKKLMLSKVAEVAKDGTVKIVIARKALYPYMSEPKLLALGKQYAKARARFKPGKVDTPELGLVDIVDRIKAIFDKLAESNKSKLKDPGAKDALAKALVRHLVLKIKNNPKPQDGIGILWTKTGKGGSFKIKPSTVKVRVRRPAKDSRGRTKRTADGRTIYRWKTVTKDGFKVSDIDLPDRFDGGKSKFGFPELYTAKLGKDMKGTLLGNLYLGVTYMPGDGVTHYQIAQIGYQLQKGGFLLGFKVGAENIEGQNSDRFTRASEGGPITNVPFSMQGPYSIARYKASAFLGYTGKVGKFTLTGKATGGLLSTRSDIPGSVSRDLIDSNAVNATLSGSRMLGAMATFNAVFKDKKKDPTHTASLTLGFKGGKITSAALKSKVDGEDSENPHWMDGAHVTAWLAGSYAYKKYFMAKAGIGYDKQMAGKLENPALTGMLRVPAGSQISGSVDLTITPLHRMKIGGGYDLSVVLNGGLAGWTQNYDRLQAPNKANEMIGYGMAELRLGTKNWGDFSVFGVFNYLSGSYTSYLVTDPRTNDVIKQTVDYSGFIAGGGLSWKIRGLRLACGIYGRKIQSSKASGSKTGTNVTCSVHAPF